MIKTWWGNTNRLEFEVFCSNLNEENKNKMKRKIWTKKIKKLELLEKVTSLKKKNKKAEKENKKTEKDGKGLKLKKTNWNNEIWWKCEATKCARKLIESTHSSDTDHVDFAEKARVLKKNTIRKSSSYVKNIKKFRWISCGDECIKNVQDVTLRKIIFVTTVILR